MSDEHWLRRVVREYFEATPPENRHHAELADRILAEERRQFPPRFGAYCTKCGIHFEGDSMVEAASRLATHEPRCDMRRPWRAKFE